MSSTELENLFAKKFIARTDVKAVQTSNGEWMPAREKKDGPPIPWSRQDLTRHIARQQTFGHYLLNTDDQCKILCFDIDLKKESGILPDAWDNNGVPISWYEESDLRAAWHNRDLILGQRRQWMKQQFRHMVALLSKTIFDNLGLQVAATYSGNKGCHVYAFFNDLIPAVDAVEGANLVLEAIGNFYPTVHNRETGTRDINPGGDNFYQYLVDSDDWSDHYDNMVIEIFPKQTSVNGSGFGNLLKLPLGTNLKYPKDPCFFIDLRSPMNILQPIDPIWSLTTTNPWADQAHG